MKMLEIYGPSGFLVLRTRYLKGWELSASRQYYETMGYIVKEFG